MPCWCLAGWCLARVLVFGWLLAGLRLVLLARSWLMRKLASAGLVDSWIGLGWVLGVGRV